MGWESIISLAVMGSRVKLLFLFVFFAILFAAILIFIEFRVKTKTTKKEEEKGKGDFSKKILRYKKVDKTPREKLDLLDKAAKEYFKEKFELGPNKDYAALIDFFKESKLDEFVTFSKAMFSTYYGSEEIRGEKVLNVIDLFVKATHKKNITEKAKEKTGVMGRLEKFIDKRRESVISKRLSKKARNAEKKLQKKKASKEKKVERKERRRLRISRKKHAKLIKTLQAEKQKKKITTKNRGPKPKKVLHKKEKPETKKRKRIFRTRKKKKKSFEEERKAWKGKIKKRVVKIKKSHSRKSHSKK
jgi:hypothetical protein